MNPGNTIDGPFVARGREPSPRPGGPQEQSPPGLGWPVSTKEVDSRAQSRDHIPSLMKGPRTQEISREGNPWADQLLSENTSSTKALHRQRTIDQLMLSPFRLWR